MKVLNFKLKAFPCIHFYDLWVLSVLQLPFYVVIVGVLNSSNPNSSKFQLTEHQRYDYILVTSFSGIM
jgi:hypothetical protein